MTTSEGRAVTGIIQSIEEVLGAENIPAIAPLNGQGGRLGFSQMLSALTGRASMDGYKVVTDHQTIQVLIDNEESCCETWGYLASEDDLTPYIGAELREIRLTDTALNTERVIASDYYEDEGGIQFVDFVTDRGTFQLAVYNGHNGYYGHGILVALGDEILLNETL